MDLLKRYLLPVKFWLPTAQQDDILAELSEDILSEAEDREATLARLSQLEGLSVNKSHRISRGTI